MTRSDRKWLEPVEDWQKRLDDAVALATVTVAKMRSGELEPPPTQAVSPVLPAQARMALRSLSAEKRAILDSPQSGVVSAGAGSGKTTLLARAVYEDVVVRGIPVDEILVVAFNNAAAAHLVARIQDEFVLGRDPAKPAVDLSCAWVGTFHALCGRIVRERAHAADVAPDFVVLDELEGRMLLELALDEAGETCEHPGVVAMLAAFSDARVAARSVLNRGRAAGERVPEDVRTLDLRALAREPRGLQTHTPSGVFGPAERRYPGRSAASTCERVRTKSANSQAPRASRTSTGKKTFPVDLGGCVTQRSRRGDPRHSEFGSARASATICLRERGR